MNWKVGDEFWVDYDNLTKDESAHSTDSWKNTWFPQQDQPFKIAEIKKDEVKCTNGYVINPRYIYNKSMIINQILNEL